MIPTSKQQQEPHIQMPSSATQAASAAAPPLGPAALVLVKQELGALPSQQQQKYWQLADLPYDPAELSQLLEHYLQPYIAQRHVAHELRSGRGTREAQALIRVKTPRIQQHHPVLAPAVLQLHAQVEREEQQQQQEQQRQQEEHQQQQEHKQHPQQQHVSSSTPSSERLLLVLRCLFLWGKHQAQEQQLPSLLQNLLVRARAAAAPGDGELMDDSNVQEVVDLTHEHEDDEVAQEQLEAFLAGECEVMLVREMQGKRQHGQQRVKPDPEGKEAAAQADTMPSQQQVGNKRNIAAVAEADGRCKEVWLSAKRPSRAGRQGAVCEATAVAEPEAPAAAAGVEAGGAVAREAAADSRAAEAAAAGRVGGVVAGGTVPGEGAADSRAAEPATGAAGGVAAPAPAAQQPAALSPGILAAGVSSGAANQIRPQQRVYLTHPQYVQLMAAMQAQQQAQQLREQQQQQQQQNKQQLQQQQAMPHPYIFNPMFLPQTTAAGPGAASGMMAAAAASAAAKQLGASAASLGSHGTGGE